MSQLLGLGGWPDWVIRKIGDPIILEADWNYQNIPNPKWGAILDGGSVLSIDESVAIFGGKRAIKMITDAVGNHSCEIKASFSPICKPGDLLAMEFKWTQAFVNASTNYHLGIESRDQTNILQARFRWVPNIGEWRYEDASLAYQPIPAGGGGPLLIDAPSISATAGNSYGWVRVVIDPINRIIVGIEASGKNGKIETRDMRPLQIPLTANGGSGGNRIYLIFAMVVTANGASVAETGYLTDLCFTKIRAGVDPFIP